MLLASRLLLGLLVILALVQPALQWPVKQRHVVWVVDIPRSQGADVIKESLQWVEHTASRMAPDTLHGVVLAGERPVVLRPMQSGSPTHLVASLPQTLPDQQTDLGSALRVALGLMPSGGHGRVVLLSDGMETLGHALGSARELASWGVPIDVMPRPGMALPDVRLASLTPSRLRSHEGAAVFLTAQVSGNLSGTGEISLFENGIEVERRPVTLEQGETTVVFRRVPDRRNLYHYRAVLKGFTEDQNLVNNEAMAMIDVLGRPILLLVEGEPGESRYLIRAMEQEGIRLEERPAPALPETAAALAGYDGVIFSDLAARELTDSQMAALRDYVEVLGGGFIMVGGMNSFGVGGYFRTPIEEILPVKIKPPDQEIEHSIALVLVIDRSGSMSGEKLEICKAAAIGTADLLSEKDYLGVIAFDQTPQRVVPLERLSSRSTVQSQIATIVPGGGTFIFPAMQEAFSDLSRVQAKVKHMIVLTDGHSQPGPFQQLASQIRGDGITISTLAVGEGADVGLLQIIAETGGGSFYLAKDPTSIPRIFTQDTMIHSGRLIREDAFRPRLVEDHPMVRGLPSPWPVLLGYVRTLPRNTARVPLLTDQGDPLLAVWQFGLGRVTAFTSDAKSRWASLWVAGWPGFGQLWAQIIRETSRPPQGRNLDLRLVPESSALRVEVEARTEAFEPALEARIHAELFFQSLQGEGEMNRLGEIRLDPVGAGRFEGRFAPDEPGTYLVRLVSGRDIVSGGYVRNASGEAMTGEVNHLLLNQIVKTGGGSRLTENESPSLNEGSATILIELDYWLILAFLWLWMVDIAIRRWENLLALAEGVRGWFPRAHAG